MTRTLLRTAAAAVSATTGLTALTGLAALPASAAPPAPRAGVVSLFPSDDLTVRDPAQLTGRRVALPTSGCTTVVTCGLVERLDQLDGFDLDPRLAIRFDRPVDPAAVAAATTVDQVGGGGGAQTTGVDRVVYDAATSTVYAHPDRQLAPGTTYRLRVRPSPGLPQAQTTFTTLSATDGLLDLRRQIDSGTAFAAAGIAPDERGLTVEGVFPLGGGTTLEQLRDTGAPDLVPVPVPSASAGTLVLGSFLAPSWLRPDRTIAQTPTGDAGPSPVGAERLPFALVLPVGTAPQGGWPTAVFGHGFTRDDSDLLLAAATASRSGVATIATDVVGHGYGPRTQWRVTVGGVATTLPAHARGVDLEGDGVIGSAEGSGTLPGSPQAAVSSRDGLRQTVADVMTLVRAVGRGPSVAGAALRPTGVTYFGQSFGGIYGTMLAGTDPQVARSALNVAGGPVTEIARLSPAFRLLSTQALGLAGLLNGGYLGFTESLPLKGDPPVTAPAPGALPIQQYLADSTWLTRPGSPETFAPLVPDERALFQVAKGDQTVPNPTAYTLLQAGDLFDRASLYRNDLTPQAGSNPHGFLLNPAFPAGFGPGQAQVVTFLLTGQTIDPDGAGPVWEVPVQDPQGLRDLAFPSPLHD